MAERVLYVCTALLRCFLTDPWAEHFPAGAVRAAEALVEQGDTEAGEVLSRAFGHLPLSDLLRPRASHAARRALEQTARVCAMALLRAKPNGTLEAHEARAAWHQIGDALERFGEALAHHAIGVMRDPVARDAAGAGLACARAVLGGSVAERLPHLSERLLAPVPEPLRSAPPNRWWSGRGWVALAWLEILNPEREPDLVPDLVPATSAPVAAGGAPGEEEVERRGKSVLGSAPAFERHEGRATLIEDLHGDWLRIDPLSGGRVAFDADLPVYRFDAPRLGAIIRALEPFAGGHQAAPQPSCGAHGPRGAMCQRAEGHGSPTHWGSSWETWVGDVAASALASDPEPFVLVETEGERVRTTITDVDGDDLTIAAGGELIWVSHNHLPLALLDAPRVRALFRALLPHVELGAGAADAEPWDLRDWDRVACRTLAALEVCYLREEDQNLKSLIGNAHDEIVHAVTWAPSPRARAQAALAVLHEGNRLPLEREAIRDLVEFWAGAAGLDLARFLPEDGPGSWSTVAVLRALAESAS